MHERDSLRALPLLTVLFQLGINQEWKSRKEGTEYYGPCPACQPKKNQGNFSFHVDGRFRCFSCNFRGRGAIDLVIQLRHCGFQQALDILSEFDCRPAQAPPPPPSPLERAENEPFKASYEKFQVRPSQWLSNRGLSQETLDDFEVFEYYNPKRRSIYNGSVMLKIRRMSDSECVGYLVRNIGEISAQKPKYTFPKGFAKANELYGAIQVLKSGLTIPRPRLFVVESPFTVLKFYQLGFQAVSTFGWSISDKQAEALREIAKGAVFVPDKNKYKEAQLYAGILAQKLWVKMPEISIEDPEYLSKEEIQSIA